MRVLPRPVPATEQQPKEQHPTKKALLTCLGLALIVIPPIFLAWCVGAFINQGWSPALWGETNRSFAALVWLAAQMLWAGFIALSLEKGARQ